MAPKMGKIDIDYQVRLLWRCVGGAKRRRFDLTTLNAYVNKSTTRGSNLRLAYMLFFFLLHEVTLFRVIYTGASTFSLVSLFSMCGSRRVVAFGGCHFYGRVDCSLRRVGPSRARLRRHLGRAVLPTSGPVIETSRTRRDSFQTTPRSTFCFSSQKKNVRFICRKRGRTSSPSAANDTATNTYE